MQLDHNRIVIRERDYMDILDLALRMVREYGLPLAVALGCGVIPMACLNAWLLAPYVEVDIELQFPATYLLYMFLLIMLEAPLATAPATLYLGEALFTEQPNVREIARKFWQSLPQLLLFQVILRSLLIVIFFAWLLATTRPGVFIAVISIFLIISWAAFSSGWPYLGEVILLERNPLRGKSSGRMTTNRRRRLLHAGYSSELFSRWVATLGIGMLLFIAAWSAMFAAGRTLWNEWDVFGAPSIHFNYPLALWLVVGFLSVVRFLGYLDLRIRREGWEVELMIRAEQARLTRQLT